MVSDYYPPEANCRTCQHFVPGKAVPTLGSCREFPLGARDVDAATPCRCLFYEKTREGER